MKNKELVCGVGINDADYVVEKKETIGYVDGKRKQKLVWSCTFYNTWKHMIERCYSAKYQEKRSSYIGCSVSDEWLLFSNFKSWMEQQDFEGKALDKDILFEGNKVYSPDTCVFVSPTVNSFVIDCRASRGQYLIGVSYHKRDKKFEAYCSNPFTKKQEYLGRFSTEQDGHYAWKKRKLELAHELADIQSDQRVARALIQRYS